MIKQIDIKNRIELELNNIAREYEYEIEFVGELGFYDYDWVKKQMGVVATPFVLVPNRWQRQVGSAVAFDFTFSIIALPKEQDRDLIVKIFDRLANDLPTLKIEQNNVSFKTTSLKYFKGEMEGSGSGIERFHVELVFEGTATNAYGYKDMELTFGNEVIGIDSFKYEHSKTNYINVFSEYLDSNNHNLNANLFVIETTLTKGGSVLNKLLNKGQMVNIEDNLLFKIDNVVIVDALYSFNNYSLTFDKEVNEFRVFLFFEMAGDKNEISLGDDSVKILDYALTTTMNTLPHNRPNDNIYRYNYVGRARAYAFNVAETSDNALLNRFTSELMSDLDTNPIYNLKIKLHGEVYEKRLILMEISKETKETANSVLTITFQDAGDL